MTQSSLSIRRIAVSALLMSVALVLNTFFTIYLPLFGENGVSVGISGIFSMLPSVLFGPGYGAAVSGLNDLLGYLIKPMGAFMPLITFTAALGGALRGWLYFAFRKARPARVRAAIIALSALLLLAGLYALYCFRADGLANLFTGEETADPAQMHALSRVLAERAAGTKDPAGNLATYRTLITGGLFLCAALGLCLLMSDAIASKRAADAQAQTGTLALTLAVLLSGVIVTTLNTVILRETVYASWKVFPFIAIWLPRLLEEILVGTVKACLMLPLLATFHRQSALRRIAR